jgi:hypothetical protein
VIHIEHVDDLGGFVEAIAHSVLASSPPPLALERSAKRCAGSWGLSASGPKMNSTQAAAAAADMVRWFQLICLDGARVKARPKKLRWSVFHEPGRLVRSARRDIVRILDGWPSAETLLSAYRRIVLIT